VRKSCFTLRTLGFLKFHISPWPPLSSSSAPPLSSQAATAHRCCSSVGATSCLWQLPRCPASARALLGHHLAAVVASARACSPSPFFSGPRPSVAPPPSILLSLAFSFHPELLNAVAARVLLRRTPCPPWADHPSPSRSTTAPPIASPRPCEARPPFNLAFPTLAGVLLLRRRHGHRRSPLFCSL
jgi:hypothetical protein